MDLKCPYMKQGTCEVSSLLAGMPVPLAEDACKACASQDNPLTINRVTCTKAAYTLRKAGKEVDPAILHCYATPNQGVGTQFRELTNTLKWWVSLLRLTKLIWPNPKTCGCDQVLSMLNTAGIKNCKEKKDKYTKIIVDNYLNNVKNLNWTRRFLTSIVSWMLTLCIQREEKRQKK